MSLRSCDRCTSKTADGSRCRRRTCKYGPFCWQHTMKQKRLKVAPSPLLAAGTSRRGNGSAKKKKKGKKSAGLGLFAWDPKAKDGVVFKRGEPIVPFTGKVLTPAQVKKRYPGDSKPMYTLDAGCTIDPCKTNSGVGRYANDGLFDPSTGKNRSKSLVNAGFASAALRKKCSKPNFEFPVLKAKKNIRHGEEILFGYGQYHWAGSPPSRSQTKALRTACRTGKWPKNVPVPDAKAAKKPSARSRRRAARALRKKNRAGGKSSSGAARKKKRRTKVPARKKNASVKRRRKAKRKA